MAREHRHLEDGEITVTPFTAEEEATADQHDADMLALASLPKPPTMEELDDRLKILEAK